MQMTDAISQINRSIAQAAQDAAYNTSGLLDTLLTPTLSPTIGDILEAATDFTIGFTQCVITPWLLIWLALQ